MQATLDAGDLEVQLPEVHAIARVETVAFRQVASGELTLRDLVEEPPRPTLTLAAGKRG